MFEHVLCIIDVYSSSAVSPCCTRGPIQGKDLETIDLKRTGRSATAGLLIHGPLCHFWIQLMQTYLVSHPRTCFGHCYDMFLPMSRAQRSDPVLRFLHYSSRLTQGLHKCSRTRSVDTRRRVGLHPLGSRMARRRSIVFRWESVSVFLSHV